VYPIIHNSYSYSYTVVLTLVYYSVEHITCTSVSRNYLEGKTFRGKQNFEFMAWRLTRLSKTKS